MRHASLVFRHEQLNNKEKAIKGGIFNAHNAIYPSLVHSDYSVINSSGSILELKVHVVYILVSIQLSFYGGDQRPSM